MTKNRTDAGGKNCRHNKCGDNSEFIIPDFELIKEYPLMGETIRCAKLSSGLPVFVVPKRGFNRKYAYFAADYGSIDTRFRTVQIENENKRDTKTTISNNNNSEFRIPNSEFDKDSEFGTWTQTPMGVAHFLEHSIFDTEGGSALALMAAGGASPNAYTSADITAFHFECFDNFTKNLETLLGFVSNPHFSNAKIEKERGIITQEILMNEDDHA